MIYEHDFVVFCILIAAAIHVYSEVNGCIPNLVILIIIIILLQLTHQNYWCYFLYYHNIIITVSTIVLIYVIIIIMIIISIMNVIMKSIIMSFHSITVINTSHIYIQSHMIQFVHILIIKFIDAL